MISSRFLADRFQVEDSLEAFQDLAEEQDWSDGLPLVPPTIERVTAMLAYCDRDPQESIGQVPPHWGEATYEKVAICAVMAGCRPAYFPVLCAAVSGVLEKEFNLYGIQATTNPVAPMVLVNGPISRELNFNSKGNAFGQGWRANATVGRALRLVQNNIGGAKPQTLDRATQGYPGKFSSCAAENEEQSPYEPYHVERGGCTREESAVTVFGTQAFHNVIDITSQRATELLDNLALGMAAWGTNNMTHGGQPVLVLSPEQAAICNRDGFTKDDIRQYLFQRARLDITKLPKSLTDVMRTRRPKWVDMADFPVCDRWEDILLLVIGGPGIHAVFLPSFGSTVAITRKLTKRDGTSIDSVEALRQ